MIRYTKSELDMLASNPDVIYAVVNKLAPVLAASETFDDFWRTPEAIRSKFHIDPASRRDGHHLSHMAWDAGFKAGRGKALREPDEGNDDGDDNDM